ncbi:bifunctional metallophosphatase/5'-nucleotidase [Roseburia hominis]|mgnify:FL=1|jgi:5'-nucleotidase/UDP-sugar diphosphatase|uniref:bifunctional metallophosphatase/5'-nucleotidase n=1 Tax=Roseburia hominis TaxID=301301 RepID=UPI0022E23361|nr:bifunctional UDP-sugar hydrolase/5'-nucleotidase [Roseburia hominis]
MKNKKRILTGLLAAALVVPLFAGGAQTAAAAEAAGKTLDVVFTHDTHSHLNSFSTVIDGESTEVGGFARIKTVIDEQKAENPDTLVVDGGDFSMGTLVQTVYEDEAAELRMLGAIGCEVTTFGNHEFDYRSSGLAQMLKSAAESGDVLPELVVCNVDWDAMEAAGLNDGQQQIQSGFEEYGVKDYVVLQKGDVNVAVTGVFGVDALACAPTCELLFRDPVEAVRETVAEIKANEDVDMIVCVSHSGTWEDESKSEDEILAKSVPDLDLIISGHTHTELAEPIVHGDTYIVSTGEYGKKIGKLSMTQKSDGRWEMTDYKLVPILSTITADGATQEKIDGFMEAVDTGYLADFGYTKDEVLATNNVQFSTLHDLEYEHTEHNLGDLMSDAYVYAVENSDDFDGVPVDVSVVPSGTVRDTYTAGNITVEQVFNSFSLGIGPDGVPGYPLISVYLTGKELRTAAEIDASVSDYMTTARLYMSGLHFTYNPNRMILNRVTDVYLTDENGSRVELEDDKLYRVVADLYSGQMLSAVTDMSHGLLSLVPKYADGTPIEDFEDVIVMEGNRELKAWDSIARYMQSFEDTDGDGIANVPSYYSQMHDRKVVDESRSLGDLVKSPNKYAAMIIAVILIVIILVVLLIVLVVKLIKRIRRRKADTIQKR